MSTKRGRGESIKWIAIYWQVDDIFTHCANFDFFVLTKIRACAIITSARGGIAQLGERLNGIQEVSGSIPLISTNKKGHPTGCPFFVAAEVSGLPALRSNARGATERRKARSTTEGSIPLIHQSFGHPTGCPFLLPYSLIAVENLSRKI